MQRAVSFVAPQEAAWEPEAVGATVPSRAPAPGPALSAAVALGLDDSALLAMQALAGARPAGSAR